MQADFEVMHIDNVKLEVKRIAGDESKPVLIFLHEGLGCVQMWREFPEQLATLTGCPALVYSRLGYGRSDPCSVPRPLTYMLHEALEVLPKILQAEKIDAHILVGHSDGGSIALINAGGSPSDGLQGVITMAAHVFCEQLSVDSIAEAKVAFENSDLRERLKKYHYNNVDCAFWGWNKAWLDPNFMQWNIEQYLPGITCPQLVIQGRDDQYGTLEQVSSIKVNSSGTVEVCILDGCRHSPHKEAMQETLSVCKSFIGGIKDC